MTDTGKIEIEVPRDQHGSFDPQLIAKYQRRLPGFDDKIVSMYARGMSTREITGHTRELYGIDVSPDLISTVTDAVLEEVAAWQARPPRGDRRVVRRGPSLCPALNRSAAQNAGDGAPGRRRS